MVTPAVRREAVAQVRVAFEVSERRACSALGVDRTSVRYRSIRPDASVRNLRSKIYDPGAANHAFLVRTSLPDRLTDVHSTTLEIIHKIWLRFAKSAIKGRRKADLL